jgi:hypothetical protein
MSARGTKQTVTNLEGVKLGSHSESKAPMARGPLFCSAPPSFLPLNNSEITPLDNRSLSCVGAALSPEEGFSDAHHVQSNRRSGSNRHGRTRAYRLSPRRQWFCRWCRVAGIWRRSRCRQRARTANGVRRSATAGLLRATATGLRGATSLRRARTCLRWTGILRASVSRSSTLGPPTLSSVNEKSGPRFSGSGSLL